MWLMGAACGYGSKSREPNRFRPVARRAMTGSEANWPAEVRTMKKIVLDGMSIAAIVPDDYPGPLEFSSATRWDMPGLLVEATGLPLDQALRDASKHSTIIAVSTDEHWIAMVNKSPTGQFSVEVVERSDES